MDISSEVFIYADDAGLSELKEYIEFLIEKRESSMHLTDGNELSKLDPEILPEDFMNVVHVKILNVSVMDDTHA